MCKQWRWLSLLHHDLPDPRGSQSAKAIPEAMSKCGRQLKMWLEVSTVLTSPGPFSHLKLTGMPVSMVTNRRWFFCSRDAVFICDPQLRIPPGNPLSNPGWYSFLIIRINKVIITSMSLTPLRKQCRWYIGVISIRLLNCKLMADTQRVKQLLKPQDEVNLKREKFRLAGDKSLSFSLQPVSV